MQIKVKDLSITLVNMFKKDNKKEPNKQTVYLIVYDAWHGFPTSLVYESKKKAESKAQSLKAKKYEDYWVKEIILIREN